MLDGGLVKEFTSPDFALNQVIGDKLVNQNSS